MAIESIPAGATFTIGAASVLAMVVGAILRGLLIPQGVYLRLLSDLDKRDAEIDRLTGIQQTMAEASDRTSRALERLSNKRERVSRE